MAAPVPAPLDEAVRPRIGAAMRRSLPSRRAALDGMIVWRGLAIGTAALILGAGMLFAIQMLETGGARPQATVTPSPRMVLAAASAAPAAAAGRPAIEASSTGSRRPAEGASGRLRTASLDPIPLPAGEQRPTAADFSRPAFLEPIEEMDGEDPPATTGSITVPTPRPRPAAALRSTPGGAEETGSLGRTGRIMRDINLREGPRRRASTIGMLKAGTKVTIYSCKSWCEVAAGGKRGYVYRRAVDL